MAREKALVTPAVLRWARETHGLDLSTAAQKLNRDPEEVEGWEEGRDAPTLAQARAMATLYRRSLAVFFLPDAPKDVRPPILPDFRRLPADFRQDFSPELRLLIRLSQMRQEWVREELESEGAASLPWIGAANEEVDSAKLASQIRKWFAINLATIESLNTNAESWQLWRNRVEQLGAFVFQSGGPSSLVVDLVEARGFALIDPFAPFIMVNGMDSEAGRIFTLIHEVVHIWIGQPGVSNLEPIERPRTPSQKIEEFCNRVAAEILVPSDAFASAWQKTAGDLHAQIATIASWFKVSREVIARRALNASYISKETYSSLRSEFIADWERQRDRQKDSEGGPSWTLMVPKRASYSLTRRALAAFADGRITGTHLAELLNSKLNRLADIAAHAGAGWKGWGEAS